MQFILIGVPMLALSADNIIVKNAVIYRHGIGKTVHFFFHVTFFMVAVNYIIVYLFRRIINPMIV